MYGQIFEGIVFNAITLTVTILFSLLLAYRSGLIKPIWKFFKLIILLLWGVLFCFTLLYLLEVSLISIFNFGPSNGSMTSILFSLFIVVIASLNLVLDFDIEEASENGAPIHGMVWRFGLLVTLVWLYLEILRLLAKMNSRD